MVSVQLPMASATSYAVRPAVRLPLIDSGKSHEFTLLHMFSGIVDVTNFDRSPGRRRVFGEYLGKSIVDS